MLAGGVTGMNRTFGEIGRLADCPAGQPAMLLANMAGWLVGRPNVRRAGMSAEDRVWFNPVSCRCPQGVDKLRSCVLVHSYKRREVAHE